MIKAILFFTFLLLSILCFATDTITPKPITLTFFELTNKLTAKHKKQLDKVANFLKKNKEYHLLLTGGASSKKQSFITNVRIRNVYNFLSTKNINDSVLHDVDSIDLDKHVVKLIFYKNIIDSNALTNLDTMGYLELNFKPFGCWLNNQNKLELQQLAKYITANNIKIQVNAWHNHTMNSYRNADCRVNRIKYYLSKVLKLNIANFEFNKVDDIMDETVQINFIYPEYNNFPLTKFP